MVGASLCSYSLIRFRPFPNPQVQKDDELMAPEYYECYKVCGPAKATCSSGYWTIFSCEAGCGSIPTKP